MNWEENTYENVAIWLQGLKCSYKGAAALKPATWLHCFYLSPSFLFKEFTGIRCCL